MGKRNGISEGHRPFYRDRKKNASRGDRRGLCLGAVVGCPVLSRLEVTRVALGHDGTRTEGFSPWG